MNDFSPSDVDGQMATEAQQWSAIHVNNSEANLALEPMRHVPPSAASQVLSETQKKRSRSARNSTAIETLQPNRRVPSSESPAMGKAKSSAILPGSPSIQEFGGHNSVQAHGIHAVDGDLVHTPSAYHFSTVEISTTIIEIREQWRRRQAWHRAAKSLTLQAKALCRRLADNGDKAEADVIYDAAMRKGEHPMADVALAAIMPLTEARDSVDRHRKMVEKQLSKLAKKLPVAPWVESVRGVGIASLAAIVGECGDLSMYANPGKVWKRLGLAPYQGKAAATWKSKGGLKAEDWVAIGYSPARRSVIWNVGLGFIKQGEDLRTVYLERKAYELARDPEMKPLHAHNRAQRYTEKRFVRMLWQAWRGGGHAEADSHRERATADISSPEDGSGLPSRETQMSAAASET